MTPLKSPTGNERSLILASSEGAAWGGKIAACHQRRHAVVYVRQSTPRQVTEHRESLARQYALYDRAVGLGWDAASVTVLDSDLGTSGGGSSRREGFQRLLADVAQDQVGLILALEMSRLARNSKDWHNLFELCAVRNTLLADEDGVYDPLDINDRLILGMKGIMSEMELHMMKSRLERGRRNKATRGELHHSVPWGYVLSADGTVEQDPDEQVRAVVRLVFDKFHELGSAHAVLRYLRRYDVKLPKRDSSGHLVWRVASESIVRTQLHHPIYAGAYSWGRRCLQTRVAADGTIRRVRMSQLPKDWTVLLLNHLPAYIPWERYLDNREKLRQNIRGPATRGTPRGGPALLGGLLYCACGRKMQVDYGSVRGGRYACSTRRLLETDQICGGLTAQVLDRLVASLLLKALSPAAIELSVLAAEHACRERARLDEQFRQRVDRARQEAQRAERNYHAVDPENRLVARTLEQRWEAALASQHEAEAAHDRFRREQPLELSAEEREQLQRLSTDIPALWHDPRTTHQQRQEIVRCLIARVTVAIAEKGQRVAIRIHWAGGHESEHELCRPVHAHRLLDNLESLTARAVELRRAGWTAAHIAAQLNAEGFVTAKQRAPFNRAVVQALFRKGGPAFVKMGVSTKGPHDWNSADLARWLSMPHKKLKDWVRRGWVRAIQRPFAGEWILRADEDELRRLSQLAQRSRRNCDAIGADQTTPSSLPSVP